MIWHFHTNQTDEATELVQRFHYSGRMAGRFVIGTAHEAGGLFGDFGPAFAACCFGEPPTRWREPVIELQRLVLDPRKRPFPLTSLISATLKVVKRRGADLVVSFADSTQSHHGGVYQASSWNYGGKRAPSNDGLVINGCYLPRRSAFSRYGTSSADALRSKNPNWVVEQTWDEGKHIYWRALRKSGKYKANRLELEALPYPKPRPI